jgi:hypothetical protein
MKFYSAAAHIPLSCVLLEADEVEELGPAPRPLEGTVALLYVGLPLDDDKFLRAPFHRVGVWTRRCRLIVVPTPLRLMNIW